MAIKIIHQLNISDLSLGLLLFNITLFLGGFIKGEVNHSFLSKHFWLVRDGYPSFTQKLLMKSRGIENHANKKVYEISSNIKRKLSFLNCYLFPSNHLSYRILNESIRILNSLTSRYM